MSNLHPPNTSLRRLTLCGLTAVLFLSSALFPAYAQVETVFGTGYCIEDTDGDGRFDFDELGSAFPESEIAAPSAVGSSFDGNEQTISITRREVNSDGTTDNTIFFRTNPLFYQDVAFDFDPAVPFIDVDADGTANGELTLDGGFNYTFDIDSRCVTGSTRTDTDTADDADPSSATHTTEAVVGSGVDVSSRDTGGFFFEGNIILSFKGDVEGDIAFADSGAAGEEGDIVLTIEDGSTIWGNLVLGNASGINAVTEDVVATNEGTLQSVIFDDSARINFTNGGTINQAGSSNDGIFARGVDDSLLIVNEAGGNISNINAGGSEQVVIENEAGGIIGAVILGDIVTDGAGGQSADTGNAFTDILTNVTNNGSIQNITADRDGQFNLTNASTGTIVSQVDNALLLLGSASLNFTNQGRIEAGSSDTISFSDYTGNFTILNTGSILAATNDAFSANESEGSFHITNRGTISSGSNRAISMNDVNTSNDEDLVVINGGSGGNGTITSNGDTITVSDTATSGDDEMSVRITNGAGSTISAVFGTAINAQDLDSLTVTNSGTISAGSDQTILADGAESLTLNNANSAASITATAVTALSADSVVGAVDIDNEGTIRAFNRTINLTDAQDSIDINNSGTIDATHATADAATGIYDNYAIYASRDGSSTGADVIVLNASSSTISINSDNALALIDFNANDDTVSITNSGTISAGRNRAIDVSGSKAVSIINNADSTISAEDNLAILTTSVETSFVLNNAGTISAAASAVFGSLATGTEVNLTNSGTIGALGGDTLRLENIGADVTFSNTGTISAGAEGGPDGTDSEDAVYLQGIGANALTFSNAASGVISATGDRAIYLNASSSITFSNAGSIGADARPVEFDVPAGGNAKLNFTNSGTISSTDDSAASLLDISNFGKPLSIINSGTLETEGARAVFGALDGTGGTVTIDNDGGSIAADEGETVYLTDIDATVSFTNSGSIEAGDDNHNGKNDAIYLAGIGANAVTFTNAASGAIAATGTRAVYINSASAITFSNANTASILADNTVIEFDVSGSPSMVFNNAGTIRATASSADHLLDFDDFTGTLDITNSGTLSTAGSQAITGTMAAGTHSLDFSNSGTILATGAVGIELGTFNGAVSFINAAGGSITAGSTATPATNAVHITGGNRVTFNNAGTITAGGTTGTNVFFDTLGVSSSAEPHSFTNSGTISGGQTAFQVSGDANGVYRLTNSGTIRSTGTGLAVDMADVPVTVVSNGSIISAGSTAMRVGGGSSITIGGPLQAQGSNPIALSLRGTGSQITLSDGARLLGDFEAVDTAAILADATNNRHTVTLSAVENASYYYDFDDRYFRFMIDGVETEQASGFSAGTSNYETSLIMHEQHGEVQRQLFHELGSTKRNEPLKTVVYTHIVDDEGGERSFDLDVERAGFAQSLQGSIFGFFDAEIVLSNQMASYAVDSNIYKLDSSYIGAGLGFSDLLSIGPFSLTALAMAGVGEVDTSRRVYTNTNTLGYIDVKSSYDTTYLDVVYEALLNMRVYGARRKLTRRNPYRINLELAFGGSLHNEDRESYSESSYVTTNGQNIVSVSNMARLRGELLMRSQTSRYPMQFYGELRFAMSSLTDGEDFTYSISGTDLTHEQEMEEVVTASLAFGGQYRLDNNIAFDFSVNYADSDNDFSAISSSAAVTWRF